MKFDNLIKIVLNEADEYIDQRELDDVDDISSDTDITSDDADITSDTAINDIEPENTMTSDDNMTDEQKIDFLVKHSKIINRNPDKTESQKIADAKSIVKNGYFDAFKEAIDDRQISDPNADISDDNSIGTEDATRDDIESLGSTYDSDVRMRKLENQDEEEFGGQDL